MSNVVKLLLSELVKCDFKRRMRRNPRPGIDARNLSAKGWRAWRRRSTRVPRFWKSNDRSPGLTLSYLYFSLEPFSIQTTISPITRAGDDESQGRRRRTVKSAGRVGGVRDSQQRHGNGVGVIGEGRHERSINSVRDITLDRYTVVVESNVFQPSSPVRWCLHGTRKTTLHVITISQLYTRVYIIIL